MFTLPHDEGAKEQKAEAQVANPNSPAVKPMEWTTSTEVTKPTNPNNDLAGRPVGSDAQVIDADKLNQSIRSATMTDPAPWLQSIYGMHTNNGIWDTDIMKMPNMIKDSVTWEYMEKKVTDKIDTGRRDKFLEDISHIRISEKQPNSGAGIWIDFGIALENTLNAINWFLNDSNAKTKEVIDNGSWANLEQAYGAFETKLKQVQNLPPWQREASIEHEVAMLKIAAIPIAEKRVAVEYWRNGDLQTATTVGLESFIQGAKKVASMFKAGSDELQGLVAKSNDMFNRKVVSYMGLDDSNNRSIYAKQKLKENRSYNQFLDLLAKQGPIFADKVKQIKNSSEITQEEIDIIRKIFEPKYLWPIKDQKNILKERFGSGYANKMFAQYDELFDVVTQSHKTRKDDLYDNVDFWDVFNGYNFAGSAPTNFLASWNSNQSWQSKSSSYNKTYSPREWYSIGWKAYG